MIINGEALEELKKLPGDSINCCISSPPYFNLRDFNCGEKEIGRENNIDDYVNNLCNIYDEVYRVLKNDGTCWINVGDRYTGNYNHSHNQGKKISEGGRWGGKGKYNGQNSIEKPTKTKSKSTKSLMLVPQRVEIELLNRGWLKPSCMPSSAKDRFTIDYEHIIFCVKSKKYYFKQQFEPFADSSKKRIEAFIKNDEHFDPKKHKVLDTSQENNNSSMAVLDRLAENYKKKGNFKEGRNMRTTWKISPARFLGRHFATFPPKLVERCLSAGCPVGGVVLDPFFGAGTVGLVAKTMSMDFIGIELNADYCEMARKRLNVNQKED
jgi:site-specific DNA-methyltransferase (adenine-specific)